MFFLSMSDKIKIWNDCQPFLVKIRSCCTSKANILLRLKHVELPPQVVIVSAIPDAII